MDANGTRFHLLLGERDFSAVLDEDASADLAWDEARQALTLKRALFVFPAASSDAPPSIEQRRGAGRDRYGNWYWIDADATQLRFLSHDGAAAEDFFSMADLARLCAPAVRKPGSFRPVAEPTPVPVAFAGLCVTSSHYLVVGTVDPGGLLVFDLHGGGPPRHLIWPIEGFEPFDLSPAPWGGLVVLDRTHRRFWALDDRFQVITEDQAEQILRPAHIPTFHPVGGTAEEVPAVSFPQGISLASATPLAAVDPISIEALPDGTVLILDRDPALDYGVITRHSFGEELAPALSLEEALDGAVEEGSPTAVRGYDLAFVPGEVSGAAFDGTVFVVDAGGNQSFAFPLAVDKDGAATWSEVTSRFYPMRLFGGRGLVTAGASAFYDLEDRWYELVHQPRGRYHSAGTLEWGPLDGKTPGCVWHRLVIDAAVPPGTRLRVWSRAADLADLAQQMPWVEEPAPLLRASGSELPWEQIWSEDERKAAGTGSWELLFQATRGRYACVRIALVGSGRATPRVRAVRAWYPRFSWLAAYLPAVYREDEASASFLDRFLANTEGMLTPLEGKIAAIERLFDPRSAPAEWLEWLAGWYGLTLDPDWEESRRRLCLRHLMALYNQRGTVRGLIQALRLTLDPCPDDGIFADEEGCACGVTPTARDTVRVVEKFRTRGIPGVVYGDVTDTQGPTSYVEGESWTPAQGSEPLHERWRSWLAARYAAEGEALAAALTAAWGEPISDAATLTLSPVTPTVKEVAVDWRAFLRDGLGFAYAAVTGDDLGAWRRFLAARYRLPARLNQAWGLLGAAAITRFSQVQLPPEETFPAGGTRLYDWIQFTSSLLPIRRSAHQFVVLVSISPDLDTDQAKQRLDKARRVVELMAPSHTRWEVAGFWAMLRVGEARIGYETLLDRGIRYVPLELGKGKVAESFLAPAHPFGVEDRFVTGREGVLPPRAR